MRFAGVFGIVVGIAMIGQWVYSLAVGRVPELVQAPLAIGFHLAAEMLTALALLASGAALLKKLAWGRPLFLVAGGMVLYSIIASPGYFAQKGAWPMVVVFGVLFVAALAALMAAAFGPRPE